MSINTIRYFDQSEMEFYLNEDSAKDEIKKLPENKLYRAAAGVVVILGLVAGSIGLLSYIEKNLSKDI